MNVSGKIFKVNDIESGEGKNGTWQKRQIVIEIQNGKYAKKIAVVFWGEMATNDFVVGKDINVDTDVESREFNEKWFTNVQGWRINNSQQQTIPQQQQQTNYSSTPSNTTASTTSSDVPANTIDDDLPF